MPIIGIEGPDEAINTETARAVAGISRGIFINDLTLSVPMTDLQLRMASEHDVDRRFGFFRNLNRLHMDMARSRVNDRNSVATLGATIYKTVAIHQINGSIPAEDFDIPDLLKPDFSVVLCLYDDDLAPSPDDKSSDLNNRRRQLMERYRKFNLTCIDASRPIEQIAAMVVVLAGI